MTAPCFHRLCGRQQNDGLTIRNKTTEELLAADQGDHGGQRSDRQKAYEEAYAPR